MMCMRLDATSDAPTRTSETRETKLLGLQRQTWFNRYLVQQILGSTSYVVLYSRPYGTKMH